MNKQTTNSGTMYWIVLLWIRHYTEAVVIDYIRNDLSLLEKLSRTWLNSKLMNCNITVLFKNGPLFRHSITLHVELLKVSFCKHAQKDQSTGKCLSDIINVKVCMFVIQSQCKYSTDLPGNRDWIFSRLTYRKLFILDKFMGSHGICEKPKFAITIYSHCCR